jgi:hypothetical protein
LGLYEDEVHISSISDHVWLALLGSDGDHLRELLEQPRQWLVYSIAIGPVTEACGNGVVEPGELCDGSDFGGTTCADNGSAGGQLICLGKPECGSVGFALCHPKLDPTCSYQVITGSGACPSIGGLMGQANSACVGIVTWSAVGETCGIDGAKQYAYSCCPETLPASCGNGVGELGEECDGNDMGKLQGKTCEDMNFGGGQIGCSKSCTFVTDTCVKPTNCGRPC